MTNLKHKSTSCPRHGPKHLTHTSDILTNLKYLVILLWGQCSSELWSDNWNIHSILDIHGQLMNSVPWKQHCYIGPVGQSSEQDTQRSALIRLRSSGELSPG